MVAMEVMGEMPVMVMVAVEVVVALVMGEL